MFPVDFIKRMQFILKDDYLKFETSFKEDNPKSIRINTSKISPDDFLKLSPFKLEKVPYTLDGFYVQSESLGNHPFHHAGLYYIQDASAMMPVNTVDLKKDALILDLCAAPGGKSGQIASKIPEGVLIANEINPNRAKILFSNIERMGLKNTIILNNDAFTLQKKFAKTFDVIFLDAPCSGEGMFRKDPSTIQTWSLKKITECVQIQKELLKSADMMLKDGGLLVYSTCTYNLEENEMQLTDFLSNHAYEVLNVKEEVQKYAMPGLTLDGINPKLKKAVRFYPHTFKGEGQFACVLKKAGQSQKMSFDYPQNDLISKYIKDDVQLKLNVEVYQEHFYTKLPLNLNGLKIISSGVKLGELKNGRFIYHHNFVTAYGEYFKNKLNLSLNDERLSQYLKGYEIKDENVADGYGVILVENYPLGLFKASHGILKNHYPKGLRLVDHG